jgi:predicted 2-oxoglutarate/Fe(II)-dependent dioxygenase YbiX
MYLNDPSEYDGGIIYFPNQDFSYKPKQYSAVFFPSSGSEYIHGITTITRGERFTGLYMHTSRPKHADPDFVLESQKPLRWKAQQYELTKY